MNFGGMGLGFSKLGINSFEIKLLGVLAYLRFNLATNSQYIGQVI